MKEKTLAEKLREELAYNPKNGGLKLTEDQLRRAYEFCDDYKEFLDAAKTEREAVAEWLDNRVVETVVKSVA